MGRLRTIKNCFALIKDSQFLLKNEKFKFKKNKNYFLEIGCGKGQFLMKNAIKNPKNIYLGIEKYPTIIYKAIKKIQRKEYHFSNIFFFCYDAKNLLDLFSQNKFKKIFLNFPDPWPKNCHKKRRLTSSFFLNLYKKLLIKDGIVEFKTDNDDLFAYTLENLSKNKIKILYYSSNFYKDLNNKFNQNNLSTEYEDKFVLLGKNINKIIWKY